jgi:uncharacterized protein YjbJ (UPF0337 family)
MRISSLYKQFIRAVKFSIVALICSVAINFVSAAPSVASQLQAPTPHLAIFGWGEREKTEGKVEQVVGKVQAKTGERLEGTAKQVDGRAKSDLGRVEDAAQNTANKADKMAKDMKKGTDKNLGKVGDSIKDTANGLVDGAKKIINN